MAEPIVVLTTLGSEEDAVRLARALLDRRLCACVNIVPAVRSLYVWRGGIEDEREFLLLIKTQTSRYQALAEAIDELHPYEVPELIALDIGRGSSRYLSWLSDGVS